MRVRHQRSVKDEIRTNFVRVIERSEPLFPVCMVTRTGDPAIVNALSFCGTILSVGFTWNRKERIIARPGESA